jgi:class I fructose-bisphosphate aldolase
MTATANSRLFSLSGLISECPVSKRFGAIDPHHQEPISMKMTPKVQKILSNYESDNPGTKANLARILMQGRLGGTGRLVILPVDQGFEHGPARSFAPNPAAYDPHYHFQLALEAGLSAYAAPLGMIEAGAGSFAGQIPTILKVNSSNSLASAKDQAITGSVGDALRLGCSAIGFTIYPGSDHCFEMMAEIRELAEEAKSVGLAVVVWSYPRGGGLSKEGETAIDITAYAAHMAALLGAHIIKVKPPTAHLEQAEAKKVYEKEKIPVGTLAERIAHVVQSCFNGRRLVVFSGGAAKDTKGILEEVKSLRDGGATGSIIGRNTFQRPREEALKMLDQIIGIYKGE